MYILTQNKKVLMEFGRIEISTNLTMKKDEKYVLVARDRGGSVSLADTVIIGTYPDEESARRELMSIYMALNANQTIYEIK